MKLFPNLVRGVTDALWQIFSEERYADKVIEKLFKSNLRWGARDRAFIAENTYDMVRWWRLINFVADTDNQLTPENLYKLFAVWQIMSGNEIPDWTEFKGVDKKRVFQRLEEARKTRKIIQSVPDWLDELGEKELGANWENEINALNNQARVVLRANTLKVSMLKLGGQLEKENIPTQTIEGVNDALVLEHRRNIFTSQYFKDGCFEVQDAGSQLIAPFMDVKPGMRVVDACAGAGGKTLHIASMMQNKGRIIALDTEDWKLNELKKRAKRNGVSIIETRQIESSKVIKRLYDTADRLLLDVPCSGLGVLRRNPDAKWKLNLDFIERVKQTQQEILSSYSNIIKVGGQLVYATCSIMPSENEKQVEKFLEEKKDCFKLIKQKSISPASFGFDGFYMALIERIK